MEAHTRFDIQMAFVATGQDVTKIWKTLQDRGMEVTAAASCSDGLVRYFITSELLVQYENPKRAAITALEISGRSREPYSTAEISLGARYSAPVSVSIRGEESLVSAMRTRVTDTLNGMKPWYSRISTIDMFYVWFPIFWVLASLVWIMTPSSPTKPAIPFRKALEFLAIGLAVFGFIVAVVWGVGWARKRFFPVATFAIGQGSSRHQHYEQVRWVVIIGFLIGVAASIVSTLLLAA